MIADFGISHIVLTRLKTTTLVSTGTPYWTAPELATQPGARPTFESDIWSFGCLAFEVLTDKAPFYSFNRPPQLLVAFVQRKVTPLSSSVSSPEDTNHIDIRVRKLMERCFNYLADAHRPKSGEIVQFFADLNIPDNRPLGDSTPIATHRARTDIQIDYQRVYKLLELVEENMRDSKKTVEDEKK
ncbi:Serine/threonine-protein kinase sepA [Leucoagaricus sp. SymC.cos]|nr:Serine/threonine-protein kinase sepA [Leucoagaricus sp. SymC.cos]